MNTSKRILFISYDGLTDSLGQSQILPYFKGLSKKGYKITILSCDKEGNFKKNKAIVKQKVEEASITWISVKYKDKLPVISPTLNARRLKKKAFELAKKESFDIVHCRSIIPAQIGYALAKKFKMKFIFDIRGFWADERVDGEIWNPKNPIFNYLYHHFKRKEKFLFEKADTIVTLTQNAKNYIKENFKTKGQFTVVPCCVDFEHFNLKEIKEQEVKDLKKKIGIPSDSYVLTYIGSLGARYQLTEMLQFFKTLQEKEPNASFLIISKSDTSQIESEASEMGIDPQTIYITACEYVDIPTYIAIGTASIFFIVTSFSGKAVSPTKQAEVMSLGLPIVANSGLGDTDIILKSTNTGIIVDNYDKKSMENAVEKLLNFKKTKQEIRATAIDYFTLESGINKYHNTYLNL